jgi:predicted GH43/DUF377 family glycosyl hydrolase
MRQPDRFFRLLPALALLSAGCAGYTEFSLPPQPGSAAVSSFRWNPNPSPVLSRGTQGEWDSVDVLNPSVVKRGGLYYNLYSGYDGGTWHTGLATSSDGLNWTKQGKVLSPSATTWEGGYIAANGSALVSEDFLYWYQAGRLPSIGLARSTDGRRWTKLAGPVLRPGPRGSWDERGVADPCVVRVSCVYYMYYLGQDRARRQRLGVARSKDGVRWRKLRTNPILELGAAGAFDESGLGEPAVWISQGRYWMLYTGRDRWENRRIGFAWSADGVRWKRLAAGSVFAGGQAWNSRVVCDPSVLAEGDLIRVWFGGGDVASPDQNLHGQIGLAILEPAGPSSSGKRAVR